MSSTESTSASRHYLKEMANRLGEQSAVWGLPRLIATGFMMERQERAAQRLREAHLLDLHTHAKAVGVDPEKVIQPDVTADGDDEMGGIRVQGDTTNHYHTQPAQTSSAGKVATVAGAALLGAAAPAAVLLWQSLRGSDPEPAEQPPTVINQPADPQDWRLDLEIVPAQ